MARTQLLLALSLIVAHSPVSASSTQLAVTPAPPGTDQTKYCLRVEPTTGSRIETIECWTRQQWSEQGVDVDQEWGEEGVRVIA